MGVVTTWDWGTLNCTDDDMPLCTVEKSFSVLTIPTVSFRSVVLVVNVGKGGVVGIPGIFGIVFWYDIDDTMESLPEWK